MKSVWGILTILGAVIAAAVSGIIWYNNHLFEKFAETQNIQAILKYLYIDLFAWFSFHWMEVYKRHKLNNS